MKYVAVALPQIFKKVEDAAPTTEKIIEKYASEGYEFVGIYVRNVLQKPGCIAGLMGRKESFFTLDVAVFRK